MLKGLCGHESTMDAHQRPRKPISNSAFSERMFHLMIPKIPARKPWRHFGKKHDNGFLIRKFCCGVLILEAALLVRDFKEAQLHTAREEFHETWFLEDGGGKSGGEGSIVEEYFGIRFRVEDGALELYRREESRRVLDP